MKHLSNSGYTVLEVMVVMAVSAGLFFTAITAFGGRQQEVQFTQAVRDFDSRLSDISNDIASGFFNNSDNLECNVVSAPPPAMKKLNIFSGSDLQGASDKCVFIGKVLQFQPQGLSENKSKFKLITVLGSRYITASGTSPVNNLSEAAPKAIEQNVETIDLDWGLRVTKILYQNASVPSGQNIGSFGYFTSFTQSFTDGISEATLSDNQRVQHIPVLGSSFNSPTDDTGILGDIETVTSPASPTEIIICLQKADQSKRAMITVGKDGSYGTSVDFTESANYDSRCNTDA